MWIALYLIELLHCSHDEECPLLLRKIQVISHVHPQRPQLGHAVVPDRDPIRYQIPMYLVVGIGLCQ